MKRRAPAIASSRFQGPGAYAVDPMPRASCSTCASWRRNGRICLHEGFLTLS
jgi:hypothetical protein